MKKLTIVLAVLIVLDMGVRLLSPIAAAAQGQQQTSWGLTSGPVTSCPAPIAGATWLCAVTGVGLEQSVEGAAYAPIGSGGGASISFSQILGTATLAQLPSIPTTKITGQITPAQLPASASCKEQLSVTAPQTVIVGPCQ